MATNRPSWECKHLPSWNSDESCNSRYRNDLQISKMSDSEFPSLIFYHFCRVKRFILTNQHLKRIEATDLQNADSVNLLNLAGNEIERIEANTFVHAPNLKDIDLSSNAIEFIDDQAFNNVSLRTINLRENKIMNFTWQPVDERSYCYIWSGNERFLIETVDMSDLDTSFKNDASFNPFARNANPIRMKGDEIMIQNNDLESVILHQQTKKLDASHNRISKIIFDEDSNGNSSLGRSEFKLSVLNLSNNSITSVLGLELQRFAVLEELDLSNNLLESLAGSSFLPLKNLKRVRLSNNKFRSLNVGSTFNTLLLEYLDVSDNNLGSFRLNNIFPNLVELQINNNSLTVLDTNIKRMAPKLEKVGLSGNNWTCDHLISAFPLIPFDHIKVDVKSEHLSSWLEGNENNNHGHVLEITCLNVNEAAVEEQERTPLSRADVEDIVDVRVAKILMKLDELTSLCKNNNV